MSWQARCVASALALLIMLLLAVSKPTAANNLLGGEDPLAPEVAYSPTVETIGADFITIRFSIADGYYLYRDKTHFSPQEPAAGFSLSKPTFPAALIVEDDYFGKQSVYRGITEITVPYQSNNQTSNINLAVRYQGCADIGLCYPPTTSVLALQLPATPSGGTQTMSPDIADNNARQSANYDLLSGSSSQNSSPLASPLIRQSSTANSSSTNLFNEPDADNELLPPELAFLPQVVSANKHAVVMRWHIESGYYLYRDKLSFSLQNPGDVRIINASTDEGLLERDEFFGDVAVLRHSAETQLALSTGVDKLTGADNQATLVINYQGCADIGVCFPPSVASLPVVFDHSSTGTASLSNAEMGESTPGESTPGESTLVSAASGESNQNGGGGANSTTSIVNANTSAKSIAASTVIEQSEQDRLFDLLSNSSLWLNVATFFGLGLLLAFTPCVLPMIPILSSLIVGQGNTISTGRAFRLSLIYVLVMASTYAAVGVAVGLSGYNIQAYLQNPWVLTIIALLFVLLSLSMFGFYELKLPTGVQTRLTSWSNRQGGGQAGSVAAMGFISSLIVGPCVTAPLAGALIYIAKTGDAVIGGAALFALGLGMGAPLLLIGTSAGKLVPKAGAWMKATQHVFGILMLAMAIYMVSRFLPITITMTLYGVLAIMSGVYLGATDTMSRQSSGWHRFGKGAGLVVSVYGLSLLVGALAGGSSYTTPLRGIMSASSGQVGQAEEHGLSFAPVKSVEGLQKVVSDASQLGKPVMLDFYADWCISCKEMEAFTFTDETVQALLANTIVIQADVTANDELDQALLKEFDLFGPPGIIFYDADGNEMPAARLVGFMPADKFSNHLSRFLGGTGI